MTSTTCKWFSNSPIVWTAKNRVENVANLRGVMLSSLLRKLFCCWDDGRTPKLLRWQRKQKQNKKERKKKTQKFESKIAWIFTMQKCAVKVENGDEKRCNKWRVEKKEEAKSEVLMLFTGETE